MSLYTVLFTLTRSVCVFASVCLVVTLSVCISGCMSVCQSDCVPVCLFVCVYVCIQFVRLTAYLSAHVRICASIFLHVCLLVSLFIFLALHNSHFHNSLNYLFTSLTSFFPCLPSFLPSFLPSSVPYSSSFLEDVFYHDLLILINLFFFFRASNKHQRR